MLSLPPAPVPANPPSRNSFIQSAELVSGELPAADLGLEGQPDAQCVFFSGDDDCLVSWPEAVPAVVG